MIGALAEALASPPYALPQAARETLLIDGLNALTARHYNSCSDYAKILDGAWGGAEPSRRLSDVPYLPAALFKAIKLQSVPDSSVRVTLTSSGTTGQAVSKIVLDGETSLIQQRALASSLSRVLGSQRLPMLVIDTDAVFSDPKSMSARGAGVLGIMRYGRNHAFALDRDLEPQPEIIRSFLRSIQGAPFLMFGFTFVVWLKFYEQLKEFGLDLSQGILLHSGGWKKMIERQVDNQVFRKALAEAFGLTRVHNFYGMVEQIGSVFLEGPEGYLFPPNFADVIIRDPKTWRPCENGTPGLIQVLSLLPHSYPGHSVLTEDLGVIDDGVGSDKWSGRGLRVLGRVERSELRGCSDVIAANQ